MRFLLFFAILTMRGIMGFSQGGPLPPVIRSVSVTDEQGHVLVNWWPSVSPGVTKYKVDTLNGRYLTSSRTIDSTAGPQTSLQVLLPTVNNRPVPFVVYSKGTEWGGISRPHSTMWLKASEYCDSIVLRWTAYKGWSGAILYRVLANEAEIARTTGTDTAYTFNSFLPGGEYLFRIEAISESGDTASSNHVRRRLYNPEKPSELYLQSVEPAEGGLLVSARLLTDGTVYSCGISRSADANGPFTFVDDTLVSGDFQWLDSGVASGVWYYRVDVLDTCRRTLEVSNVLCNILLTARFEGYEVYLNWNPAVSWPEGVDRYEIFGRYTDEEFRSFGIRTDTAFSTSFGTEPGTGRASEICFYVTAYESNGGYGSRESSNEACVQFPLRFRFINAFTPNDDITNSHFIPIADFDPREVLLIIYDQSGLPVREIRDPEGWDGTSTMGHKVPMGVYPYYFKATGYDGTVTEHYGNVTVLYP